MKQCTIQLLDEVNCKITDLELSTRKKLSNKFSYEIPGARYQPSVRLGRWNGKECFFTIGGNTFINLLPEIVPILDGEGYEIDLDDRRVNRRTFNFDPVSETSFDNITWPEGHPVEGQPILLKEHQVEAINKFLGDTQCLQELATGFGKTITTAALSSIVEKYGRTIIIVPNKTLVTQTEADYKNMRLDTGVYFGDRKEIGHTHTICTWQSIHSLVKNTKSNNIELTIDEFIEGVVCVIVDEAHSIAGKALKALLTGTMSNIPIRWGFTGTIPKEEYLWRSLHVSLGDVINRLSASDLQAEGHLANCHINIVQTVENRTFPNYQSELKFLLGDDGRISIISTLINEIKTKGNTLVLVDRISVGEELAKNIPDSVFISGTTKNKDRRSEYEMVSEATNKVIIATYQVACVGINIPRLFNIVLLEPGKSFVRTIQSIGRGLRKAHDKQEVQIWDITSSCKYSKRHLTKRKEYYREAGYPFSQEKLPY